MSDTLEIILAVFNGVFYIGGFLLSLWWLFLPIFLFFLAKGLWLKYIRQKFIDKMEWVLLEVKPPRDIQKTPRSMEQFFAGLHGVQGTPNWWERNIDGMTQRWFSLEMVSLGGEIHFFIRTVEVLRNLVEANIYAQYPEAEITEANDYVWSVPADIPSQDYDIQGRELILTKEDAYPIRTYPEFEKDAATEEQRIDPIASLLEVMSKIGQGEQIWIQTLTRPVNDKWKEDGEKLRDELVGRKAEKKQGALTKEVIAWKDAGKGVAHELVSGKPFEMAAGGESEKTDTPFLWATTKGEQSVINAIEENISKIGFETIIRFIYLAQADIFKGPNVNAIMGCFKQFNTQNLNGFKANPKISPIIDYDVQLKKPRVSHRKRKLLAAYRKRDFVQHSTVISYLKPFFFECLPILNWFFIRSKPFVFNIEELASVYHFPIEAVKSPLTPKVEAKKAEPPIGLPVG